MKGNEPVVGAIVFAFGCFPIWGALLQWKGIKIQMPDNYLLDAGTQLAVTAVGVWLALIVQAWSEERKEIKNSIQELKRFREKLVVIQIDIQNEKERTDTTRDTSTREGFINFNLLQSIFDLDHILTYDCKMMLHELRDHLNETKGRKGYLTTEFKIEEIEKISAFIGTVTEQLSLDIKVMEKVLG